MKLFQKNPSSLLSIILVIVCKTVYASSDKSTSGFSGNFEEGRFEINENDSLNTISGGDSDLHSMQTEKGSEFELESFDKSFQLTSVSDSNDLEGSETLRLGSKAKKILGKAADNLIDQQLPAKKDSIKSQKYDQPLKWIDKDELDLLIHYGWIANVAYCTPSLLEQWNCGKSTKKTPGIKVSKVIVNPITTVNAYIAIDDQRKELLIVFRGSATLVNWVYNLYFTQTKIPWKASKNIKQTSTMPQVHEGFFIDYESVAKEIFEHIVDLIKQYPTYSIRALGHSLGGALATLCALDLSEVLIETENQVYLTTFESPRVGNAAFAALVDRLLPAKKKRSIRVTHSHDIVVHLPPITMGFEHVTREYFIPQDQGKLLPISAYACSPDDGEDHRCADSYTGYSVDDHIFYPPSWDSIVFGRTAVPI